MRNKLLFYLPFIIGISLSFPSTIFSQGTWTQLPDFPGSSRGSQVSFVIGTKVYMGTGRTAAPSSLHDFWEYDGTTQAWSQKADYDTACYNAVGFAIGSKGYIGTGLYSNFVLKYFWEYDPSLNSWTHKADYPYAINRAIGFSLGNKGYIGAGQTTSTPGASYSRELYEYDPVSDSWTQKNDVPFNPMRSEMSIFNINGIQYAGLGSSALGDRKDLWQYDAGTDTWTQKADFTGSSRKSAAAFTIGNYGYVGLGLAGSSEQKDFFKYDPVANSWSQIPDFPSDERVAPAAFTLGNKGYIVGGWATGYTYDDVWVYDPNGCIVNSNFTASDTSILASETVNFTNASVNASTYSWLINGVQFSTSLNASNTFNTPGSYTVSLVATGPSCSDTFSIHISVAPDCWNGISSYSGGPRRDCFSFTVGGMGYVGGGTSNFFDYKSDFYEYNPVTTSWTQKSDMQTGRRNGAAFSIGNSGFVGTGINGTVLNDLWQWDQATDAWTQKANFPGASRNYATAFSINGKGYIGMGANLTLNQFYNDFYEYNPVSNTWITKAPYPGLSRYAAVGLSTGTKGYSALGLDGINSTVEFYEYDPVLDTWTQKTNFPGVAAAFATGFTLGNQIYLIVAATSFTSDFYMWDAVSNSWSMQQTFPGSPRQGAVAFSIGNVAYYGTGEVTGLVSDFWKFDCGTTNISDLFSDADNIKIPNPNNGTFVIQYPVEFSKSELILTNISGKILLRKVLDGNTSSKIELKYPDDGIYFYSVINGNSVLKTGKVLIIK